MTSASTCAVDGEWQSAASSRTIPDPMNGEPFISYPDTSADEGAPFVASLRRVPKTGLHNPLKHPERYNMYGAVSAAVAEEMRKPEVRRDAGLYVDRRHLARNHDATTARYEWRRCRPQSYSR